MDVVDWLIAYAQRVEQQRVAVWVLRAADEIKRLRELTAAQQAVVADQESEISLMVSAAQVLDRPES